MNTNALSMCLFAVPILYVMLKPKLTKEKETKTTSTSKLGSFLRPPFPPTIRNMLLTCRLAYMSTVDGDSSHLCLMRFTYLKDEDDGEIVILSTQRKTKKYDMLQMQNGVALLVHDFPQLGDASDGVHSITLNGRCKIVEPGEKAEKFRKAHLAHNPDYPQFIAGPDIAILTVHVTSARICNINDQVTKWSVDSS